MRKYGSIFGQILQILPTLEFYRAVMETDAEKYAKGFTCWQQFVAMLFCQLGQAHGEYSKRLILSKRFNSGNRQRIR